MFSRFGVCPQCNVRRRETGQADTSGSAPCYRRCPMTNRRDMLKGLLALPAFPVLVRRSDPPLAPVEVPAVGVPEGLVAAGGPGPLSVSERRLSVEYHHWPFSPYADEWKPLYLASQVVTDPVYTDSPGKHGGALGGWPSLTGYSLEVCGVASAFGSGAELFDVRVTYDNGVGVIGEQVYGKARYLSSVAEVGFSSYAFEVDTRPYDPVTAPWGGGSFSFNQVAEMPKVHTAL